MSSTDHFKSFNLPFFLLSTRQILNFFGFFQIYGVTCSLSDFNFALFHASSNALNVKHSVSNPLGYVSLSFEA